MYYVSMFYLTIPFNIIIYLYFSQQNIEDVDDHIMDNILFKGVLFLIIV